MNAADFSTATSRLRLVGVGMGAALRAVRWARYAGRNRSALEGLFSWRAHPTEGGSDDHRFFEGL
jgi:hypothetical protein